MPSVQSPEYIIEAENLLRRSSSNESILLSVKLSTTMSHDDHFHYGCFGRPSRRSPNVAGNNNTNTNSARRGFFSSGGRTVLPPLHLPFRTSRSPGLSSFSHAHGTRTLTVVPTQRLTRTSSQISSVNKTQHRPGGSITYPYMTNLAGQPIPVSPHFPSCIPSRPIPLTAS